MTDSRTKQLVEVAEALGWEWGSIKQSGCVPATWSVLRLSSAQDSMCQCLHRGPVSSPLPVPHPLLCGWAAALIKRQSLLPNAWNLGWPCGLLWRLACSGINAVPVLGLASRSLATSAPVSGILLL